MQVTRSNISQTEVKLEVAGEPKELNSIKEHVLNHFQDRVKLPGFRNGKAPLAVIEKNVDQSLLQTEFLEEAIQHLYVKAINEQKIRPVSRPEVNISKFVPFTTLEFTVQIPVVSEIKLPDYKKIKLPKPELTVTDQDIKDVLQTLRQRMADKKDVDREAKSGDQVWIDFSGTDEQGNPVQGAAGTDYPLVIGSNTFIPGFESNIMGLKAGQEKTFTLTFPSDYGVKALADRKVTFSVAITKVQEIIEAKLDDTFASKVGPFKSLADLKNDIKSQLTHERQHQIDREYESELVKTITLKSKLELPEILINEQVDQQLRELQQNLVYRGQTYPEFLNAEGMTEDDYRQKVLKPQAIDRLKASLVLAEIAENEGIEVEPQEVESRLNALKQQYTDLAMQEQLSSTEGRRDVAARLLTDKTVAKLVAFAQK